MRIGAGGVRRLEVERLSMQIVANICRLRVCKGTGRGEWGGLEYQASPPAGVPEVVVIGPRRWHVSVCPMSTQSNM